MNRSITNFIRNCMDEFLPPIIRDNYFFMFPFFWLAYRGRNIHETMHFKKHVTTFTKEQYDHFYNNLNSISRNRQTDLNQASIDKILDSLSENDQKVVDIGCARGFMLTKVKEKLPKSELHGCDVIDQKPDFYVYSKSVSDQLPFADSEFDTVLCTHTLEHIVNPQNFIEELKRITKKKLVIVVPKQRMYYFTLDEHVNFYQYREQLTSSIGMKNFECVNLNGDWFYIGHK